MAILNFEQLASTAPRKQALLIAQAGLESAVLETALARALAYNAQRKQFVINNKKIIVSNCNRIAVVGFNATAQAIANILRRWFHFEIALVSVRDARNYTSEDLVLVVLDAPVENGLSAEEMRISKALDEANLGLEEINTVRAHTFPFGGGNLAKQLYPATVLELTVSNQGEQVLQSVLGSPLCPGITTAHDARAILEHYAILAKAGVASCQLWETPKELGYFSSVFSKTVVSLEKVARALEQKAAELGLSAQVALDLTSLTEGASIHPGVMVGSHAVVDPFTLVSPMAAAQAGVLAYVSGNPDIPSFIFDKASHAQARALQLDFKEALETNDVHRFFEQTASIIELDETSRARNFFIFIPS